MNRVGRVPGLRTTPWSALFGYTRSRTKGSGADKGVRPTILEDMRFLVFFLAAASFAFAADPAVTQSQTLLKARKYDEAIALLAKAHTSNPKSAEITKALADSMMADDSMPPNRKYPAALREYRKVLELDKTNQKAKANVDQIEGIYKSMGRPVPQ